LIVNEVVDTEVVGMIVSWLSVVVVTTLVNDNVAVEVEV
jgi:hypothetical protein